MVNTAQVKLSQAAVRTFKAVLEHNSIRYLPLESFGALDGCYSYMWSEELMKNASNKRSQGTEQSKGVLPAWVLILKPQYVSAAVR